MGDMTRLPVLLACAVGLTLAQAGEEKALFAAGCFWSVELRFQRVPGVLGTSVGYTGAGDDPVTYEDVTTGETGHAEAVLVRYDPSIVSYDQLLDVFFISMIQQHSIDKVTMQGRSTGVPCFILM